MQPARDTTPAAWTPLSDAEVASLAAGDVVIRDNAFGATHALAVRQVLVRWHEADRLEPAGIGRAGEPSRIRRDLTTWVEPGDPDLAGVFTMFDALRQQLSNELRLSLRRFSLQAACYVPGAYYKAHRDAFKRDPSRILTAIWYLNPGWTAADGGYLRAWEPTGPRDIAPRLDRLALFLSQDVLHAVNAAHRERYALTAWYRGAEALPILPDPRVPAL